MGGAPGEASGSQDVSRETRPAPDPAVALELMAPHRLPVMERYAGLLATDGLTRGLIGPREVPRLWDRHLINCGLLAPLIATGSSVADLGSGAGLPGLVLAIARPDLHLTLIEPMARRVAFLEEVARELGLSNVEVLRARAGQGPVSRRYGVVTARALAPLPRLLDWSMPLVAEGGVLLAMKGAAADEEVEGAAEQLRRWRARAEVVTSVVPGTSPATVIRVVAEAPARIGWRESAGRRKRRGRG